MRSPAEKGNLPVEHPVEHHAERKDIRSLVLRSADVLLGGHVRKGLAALGLPKGACAIPRIDTFPRPSWHRRHFRGEVPMDDPVRVRMARPLATSMATRTASGKGSGPGSRHRAKVTPSRNSSTR